MAKLDHMKLAVKDWRASRDWYIKHLGLKVEFEILDSGQAKLGVASLQDDAGLTIFVEQVLERVHLCGCVHYFQIDEVDVKYRLLSASGG